MDSFAPEFSRFWLKAKPEPRVSEDRREDEKRSQLQRALEELAERVTAARTVV